MLRSLLFLFGAACFAQNPTSVLVQNDWVRIVRAANVPGQLSRPHVHLINRVMIHLDRGVLRIENKETGVNRDIPFRAGEVRWDPRVGLHTSENTGKTAIRIVEIELNDHPPRPANLDPRKPLPPAPGRFRAELENSQVRILRAVLQAGEQPADTVFATPVIAVRLRDGETRFREAKGEAIRNDGGETDEWVFVELK